MLDAEEQGGKPGLENSYCRFFFFLFIIKKSFETREFFKRKKKANLWVLGQNLRVLRPYLYLFPNPQVLQLRVGGCGLEVTEFRVWVSGYEN